MIFKVENVGKVQSASVELNGLTVIVGVNDSGKSTIGKSLYSVVHATAVTRQTDKTGRIAKIEDKVKQLYFHIGPIRYQYETLQKVLPVTPDMMLQQILSAESVEEVSAFLNQILKAVHDLDIVPQIRKTFIDDVVEIGVVSEEKSKNVMLADTLAEVLNAEFSNSVTTIGKNNSRFILGDEGMHVQYVDCSISNGQVVSLKTEFEHGVPYEDATYIESPLYLQQVQYIIRNKVQNTRMLLGQLPIHILDQAEKVYAQTLSSYNGQVNDDVDNIVSGQFAFDATTGLLVLKQGDRTFPINNVASGLKAFGQIQMLLKQGVISSKCILIWDEPENHLHPRWQLNFAEVLMQMTKEGYPLMITTHSPYMLQAIRFYAAEYGMEKFVKFYVSEAGSGEQVCSFSEVTDSLNRVFLTLAEPLNEIMNVDENRNKKSL